MCGPCLHAGLGWWGRSMSQHAISAWLCVLGLWREHPGVGVPLRGALLVFGSPVPAQFSSTGEKAVRRLGGC